MTANLRVMIATDQIAARVQQLAQQIDAHYAPRQTARETATNDAHCETNTTAEKLVVVGLLRGSVMFLADLCRAMHHPHEIDFMTVSSYGNQTISSGEVKVVKDLDSSIAGKHVLIVEDIIDTGHTLNNVLQLLHTREPLSISLCCLINKPSRRQVQVNVQFKGFDIADRFIVGYGLDYAEQYRHLPYIAELQLD